MKRFILLLIVTLTGSLYLYAEDIALIDPGTPGIPFEGEFQYWSNSKDYESVKILYLAKQYLIEIKYDGQTLKLVCTFRSGEIVSEPQGDIIYIFRMNGDNELRMRKLHTKKDRPEDIEWVFFRKF